MSGTIPASREKRIEVATASVLECFIRRQHSATVQQVTTGGWWWLLPFGAWWWRRTSTPLGTTVARLAEDLQRATP